MAHAVIMGKIDGRRRPGAKSVRTASTTGRHFGVSLSADRLRAGRAYEQAGRRPAVVLSPREYNRKVGLALFCPVTSHIKGYPFEVVLPSGLVVHGAVLADQLKSLDWKARQAEFAAHLPEELTAEIRAKASVLLA